MVVIGGERKGFEVPLGDLVGERLRIECRLTGVGTGGAVRKRLVV